jgi:flagellar hook-basal body complex protein FliE
MVAPLPAAGVAAAYASATKPAAAGAEDSGFGGLLQRAMQGAIDAGHQADAAATAGLTGQASVTDVVTAISRAELSLQTAVTVRDRVVAAYQEVMRMQL